MQARIDLVHEPLVFEGALEAHFGHAAVGDGPSEVPIHRLVAADVDETRQDEPRQTLPPRKNEDAVRFETDDALASVQLRNPESLPQRRYLARVEQRADGAVVVAERHHHALGAGI